MRKMIKMFSLLASVALSGAAVPALAQTAAATPAATPAAPTVAVGGMVDAYYTFNFTNSGNLATGSPINSYFYNSVSNSYTLGLAEAKVTATQGQASAHLVLAYGEETGLGLAAAGNSGVDVLQAYVSYNPDKWTFNFGRFVAWMGYEVIESSSNWNYSRSLLFGALPFWHTGFSVNYAPDSTFGITGYVVDGNGTFVASPVGKTYGLEVALNPNAMWTITLNGIMSPVSLSSNNMTAEAIIVYKPNSTWNFALDGQFGTNSVSAGTAPSYFGVALYGLYQIQSDWSACLRVEYVSDGNNNMLALYGNGAPGGQAFTGTEGTLTIGHNFTANLLGRVEGRVDMAGYPGGGANTQVFANGTATPSSSQVTGTASMVLSF